MPSVRWMRLVRKTWMKKPATDVQSCTVPRNAVRPSTSVRPLKASAAMFSCCSIRLAPIAPKAMTSAITWRCRDSRSIFSASPAPTPFSSPVEVIPERRSPPARDSTVSTSTAHTTRSEALASSRLLVPMAFTAKVRIDEPAMPPRLAPAPMKPKSRLACRAS